MCRQLVSLFTRRSQPRKVHFGGLGSEPGGSRKSSCPGCSARGSEGHSQVTCPPLNCAWCWREGGRSLSLGEGWLGLEAPEEGEEKDCRSTGLGG